MEWIGLSAVSYNVDKLRFCDVWQNLSSWFYWHKNYDDQLNSLFIIEFFKFSRNCETLCNFNAVLKFTYTLFQIEYTYYKVLYCPNDWSLCHGLVIGGTNTLSSSHSLLRDVSLICFARLPSHVLLRYKMATPKQKSFCVIEFVKCNSVITVQRRFRLRYQIDPPNGWNIRRWYQQFVDRGCLCKEKSPGRRRVSELNVTKLLVSEAARGQLHLAIRWGTPSLESPSEWISEWNSTKLLDWTSRTWRLSTSQLAFTVTRSDALWFLSVEVSLRTTFMYHHYHRT